MKLTFPVTFRPKQTHTTVHGKTVTTTDERASQRSQMSQEHIAERLSFIQKLMATNDQLVKNVHFNIQDSVAHFFAKFCEEPDVRHVVQPDVMATIASRLIAERFQALTFSVLENESRAKKLKASTITDSDVQLECNKVDQAVREYRRMVDEWMKFMEALAQRGVREFWKEAPWSVNIHKKLADDYDELMRIVKDLRVATPIRFQNLLPTDHQIAKFPRQPLSS